MCFFFLFSSVHVLLLLFEQLLIYSWFEFWMQHLELPSNKKKKNINQPFGYFFFLVLFLSLISWSRNFIPRLRIAYTLAWYMPLIMVCFFCHRFFFLHCITLYIIFTFCSCIKCISFRMFIGNCVSNRYWTKWPMSKT